MSGPQIKLLDGSFTFGEKDPAPNYPRYEREFSLLTKPLKQEQASPLDFKGQASPLWRLARLRCLAEIECIHWCKTLDNVTDDTEIYVHINKIRKLSHDHIESFLEKTYPAAEEPHKKLSPEKHERIFYETITNFAVREWDIGRDFLEFDKNYIEDASDEAYNFLLDSIKYISYYELINDKDLITHGKMPIVHTTYTKIPLIYDMKWYNKFSKKRRQNGITAAEEWHEEFTLKNIPKLLDVKYLSSTSSYPSDTLQDHIKFCDRQLRCIAIFNEFVFHNQDIIDLVGGVLSEFKEVRSSEDIKEWKIFLKKVKSMIKQDHEKQKITDHDVQPQGNDTTQNIEQQVRRNTDERRKQAYDNAEEKIRELLNAGVKDNKQIVKSMPPELLLLLTNHALGRILNELKGKSLRAEACRSCGKRARKN